MVYVKTNNPWAIHVCAGFVTALTVRQLGGGCFILLLRQSGFLREAVPHIRPLRRGSSGPKDGGPALILDEAAHVGDGVPIGVVIVCDPALSSVGWAGQKDGGEGAEQAHVFPHQ